MLFQNTVSDQLLIINLFENKLFNLLITFYLITFYFTFKIMIIKDSMMVGLIDDIDSVKYFLK